MSQFDDMVLNMTQTTPEPEDYTGEDGLLYCGKCRKPKEAYFPEGKSLFGRDRHPAQLPEGLTEASKLPEPLFTPSTKAEIGDHDENISFERCCEIVGEDIATQIRDLSLKIYKAAAEYAATRGIIIADTKFEFGVIDGKVTLIDECLTPDSSRFWPAASYEEGKIQPSYDKQFVRNWLKANWDMTGETPHLPAEVIDGTSERYREAFQIITGSQFTSMKENA